MTKYNGINIEHNINYRTLLNFLFTWRNVGFFTLNLQQISLCDTEILSKFLV